MYTIYLSPAFYLVHARHALMVVTMAVSRRITLRVDGVQYSVWLYSICRSACRFRRSRSTCHSQISGLRQQVKTQRQSNKVKQRPTGCTGRKAQVEYVNHRRRRATRPRPRDLYNSIAEGTGRTSVAHTTVSAARAHACGRAA